MDNLFIILILILLLFIINYTSITNKYINIPNNNYHNNDTKITDILNKAIFIKSYDKLAYDKLIEIIDNFLIIYTSLEKNISNIFLNENQYIQPTPLTKSQQQILINDLRDTIERIFKHLDTLIYIIPNDLIYLDAYYKFYQELRIILSTYYNNILIKYNINDHTSQYILNRTSQSKYDFID